MGISFRVPRACEHLLESIGLRRERAQRAKLAGQLLQSMLLCPEPRHRAGKARLRHRLEDVIRRRQLESLRRELVKRGDEHNRRRGVPHALGHLRRRFEPAHSRHLDVEEGELRLQPLRGLHRLQPVRHHRNDLELRPSLCQCRFKAQRKERLVVGEDRLHLGMLSLTV
jgi:hypothetical protein